VKNNPEAMNCVHVFSVLNQEGKNLLDLAINNEVNFKKLIKAATEDYYKRFYVKKNERENEEEEEGQIKEEERKQHLPLQLIADTFSLCKRLNSYGYKFTDLVKLVSLSYSQYKANGKNINLELDSNICDFLAKKNALKPEDAEIIFNKVNEKRFITEDTKERLFTYYLLKSQEKESYPEMEQIAKERIEVLEAKLQDVDGKTVISTIAKLLSYPNSLLNHNRQFYLTSLKDQQSFGNSNLLMELLDSIPDKEFFANRKWYIIFVNEFSTLYINFSRRLNIEEICRCLDKFTKYSYVKPA